MKERWEYFDEAWAELDAILSKMIWAQQDLNDAWIAPVKQTDMPAGLSSAQREWY